MGALRTEFSAPGFGVDSPSLSEHLTSEPCDVRQAEASGRAPLAPDAPYPKGFTDQGSGTASLADPLYSIQEVVGFSSGEGPVGQYCPERVVEGAQVWEIKQPSLLCNPQMN